VPPLAAALAGVPDPRRARGTRHPWPAPLLVLVCALLCGANSQRDCARWARDARRPVLRRLGVTRAGGPSLATLNRLLARVDVAALEAALGGWLQRARAAWRGAAARGLDGIAVDGKTLRGARRLGAGDAHLVSACCHRRGLVLAEVAVPDHATELAAVPPLLARVARVALAGETVTFDARCTQTAVAAAVVARGAAYLLAVKGNQPALLRACADATADRPPRPRRLLGRARTGGLAHGRLEERALVAVAAPPDLGWPHARQVLRLGRRRGSKRTGEVLSDETAYAVTSLAPEQATPAQRLALWRAHWRIENAEHWVRDAVFGEDKSTTRAGAAPQALAALRNLALSLLHLWGRRDVTAARQFFATHHHTLLSRLRIGRSRL
jgi:predicted transposase YbfD/YdcC